MVKRILYWGWLALAGVVIASAIILASLRILFPYLEDFRAEVEGWASSALGFEVTIAGLQSSWGVAGPELSLQEVDLRTPDGRSALHLQEARIGIAIIPSIIQGRLLPGKIRLVGGTFTLQAQESGELTVQGGGEAGSGDSKPRADTGITDWLLTRAQVDIRASRFIWRKPGAEQDLIFSLARLQIINAGKEHRISARLQPPNGLGRELNLIAEVRGDIQNRRGWDGELYLRGVELNSELVAQLLQQPLPVSVDELSFETWGRWKQGMPESMEGWVDAKGVYLPKITTPSQFYNAKSTITGRFLLQPNETGWRWYWPQITVAHANRSTLKITADIEQRRGEMLNISLGPLELQELAPMLAVTDSLPEPLTDFIREARPSGRLSAVNVTLPLPAKEGQENNLIADQILEQWRAQIEVENLGWTPWRKVPGITGLQAKVEIDQQGATLELASSSLQFDAAKLFRQPLSADAFSATVAIIRGSSGWSLEAPEIWLKNDHITTLSSMAVDLPQQGRPWMDLQTRFEDGVAESAPRYYPVGIMQPNLIKWLDEGVVAGQVRAGGFLYRGPFKGFPFRKNQGRFEVLADVADVQLHYRDQWPDFVGIDAQIHFDQSAFIATGASTKYQGAQLSDVRVEIPDLKRNQRLHIAGGASGPLAAGLTYLKDSPLSSMLGHTFDPVVASGKMALKLELGIPLRQDGPPVTVTGSVDFLNSGLNFTQWQLPLQRLKGRLDFSESQITAEKISGALFGGQVSLRAEGEERDGRPFSILQVSGSSIETSPLAAGFKVPLSSYASGRSDWQGRITLPMRADADGGGAQVTLSSDLVGVNIGLPEPLQKSAETPWPTVVAWHQPERARQVLAVGVRERAQAILEFSQPDTRLVKGALHFGVKQPLLPVTEGLQITGSLPRIAANEWQELATQQRGGTDSDIFDQIRLIEAKVGSLQTPWFELHDVTLALLGAPDFWYGSFTATEAEGDVSWPRDLSGDLPLIMRLQRLTLPIVTSEKSGSEVALKSASDPRQLPPLMVNIERLSRGVQALGQLKIESSRTPGGQQFRQVLLHSSLGRLELEGAWRVLADQPQSDFQVELQSRNLGALMTALGYPDTITKGETLIRGRLSWAGGPLDWNLQGLNGALNLNIKNGRIVDVEPGGGRFLGLMSLYTIPRRLFLDFSDILAKGMTFDQWQGDISFNNGIAHTDNMLLAGPSALISVSGDADLVAKRYNQRLQIVPHVSGTLPLIGAITGGASGGTLMLLFQTLFGKKIDKDSTVEYEITGRWEDPQVRRITPLKKPAQ